MISVRNEYIEHFLKGIVHFINGIAFFQIMLYLFHTYPLWYTEARVACALFNCQFHWVYHKEEDGILGFVIYAWWPSQVLISSIYFHQESCIGPI